MAWFSFFDMHSGGHSKTGFHSIFIEAKSRRKADKRFRRMFGRSPNGATCACCGDDFSINGPYETLEDASAWERGHAMYSSNPRVSMSDFEADPAKYGACIIRKEGK